MSTSRPAVLPLLLLPLASHGADPALPAAAPAGGGASAPAPELAASLGQMLFGLAVVIALLFACLWAIRRLAAPRGGGAAIKVLGAAAVGARERVVLVELGEQVLVLGVAPGSVCKLHELRKDELPQAGAGHAPAFAGGGAFAGWLKQAVERRSAP